MTKVNRIKAKIPISKIPDSILRNEVLNKDIESLPSNYTFEIHKTINFILTKHAQTVFLQFPEGLLVFAARIADILEKHAHCEVIISADIVYGACCVDDFCARMLGAQVLIHYGHSCLYPITETAHSSILYVFVEIKIDVSHFIECVCANFPPRTSLNFVCTIQFISSLHVAVDELKKRGFNCEIAQSAPLSRGEILGCTSPKFAVKPKIDMASNLSTDSTSEPKDKLSDDLDRDQFDNHPALSNATVRQSNNYIDALIYLGDGRFHIESAMIQNPTLPTYRYDPYSKILSLEKYDFPKLISTRGKSIACSRIENGTYGLIMGTLGRQGSLKVLKCLSDSFKKAGKTNVVHILVSEITPEFISRFKDSIDVFVQVACPRLSIDWGSSFCKPLLTPYEAAVMLGEAEWDENNYPMDYYSKISSGPWTPNHTSTKI